MTSSRHAAGRRRRTLLAVLATGAALYACNVAGPGHHSAAGRRAPAVVVADALPWLLGQSSSRAVVLPDSGRLLVAGGLTGAGTSTAAVDLLDPATGATTSAGALASPGHDAAGAVLSGRFYVFGGGVTSSTATVQQLGPGRAAVVGSLPAARSDLAAAVTGGRAYLVGGYGGGPPAGDVLVTSDGTHFRVLGRLPVPVRYPAVAAHGRYLWVFGGMGASGAVADVQRLDLHSGAARVVAQLPAPLDGAAATDLSGMLLVAGGRDGNAVRAEVWRFDPATRRFKMVARLPRPVANAGSAVAGEVWYLVGGEDPGPTRYVTAIRVLSRAAARTLRPSSRRSG